MILKVKSIHFKLIKTPQLPIGSYNKYLLSIYISTKKNWFIYISKSVNLTNTVYFGSVPFRFQACHCGDWGEPLAAGRR